MDWRQSIHEDLRRRNRREKGFAELVLRSGGEYCSRGGRGGIGSSSSGEADEVVKALETKLFRVQEELTELHRKKGDNAQRVIDLSHSLQLSIKEVAEKESKLLKSESLVHRLKQDIQSLADQLEELQERNQLLNDEYQALQLALNSADYKLIEAQKENDRLLAQIMEFKERDVQLMNRENEIFLQKVQLQVQQQLHEAAQEKTVHMPNEKNIQTVGQANLSVMICTAVRLPTKSYLKFTAHEGEVNCVAWNPHNSSLFTGGSDRKIKHWNIAKGTAENRGQFSGCNGSIMSLDFDTSGTLVLGASGDFASRIWSIDGCRLRHTLTGHSGKVMSAKFLSDCTKFISGSQDRTIKVWDLRSKACISTKFAGSTCNDIVTSDAMIISGHFDKKIRLYDCRSIGNLDSHQNEILVGGKITSLDLAKNGQLLLASTREDTIEIIDLRNLKSVLYSLGTPGFHIGCDWARATFSPDSEYVACGSSDGSVFIWKTNSSNPERVLKEYDSVVVAVAWQPSGNGLVSCDKNKNVVVWADI